MFVLCRTHARGVSVVSSFYARHEDGGEKRTRCARQMSGVPAVTPQKRTALRQTMWVPGLLEVVATASLPRPPRLLARMGGQSAAGRRDPTMLSRDRVGRGRIPPRRPPPL